MSYLMKQIKDNIGSLILILSILGVCTYTIVTAYSLQVQNESLNNNEDGLFLNIVIDNQKRQLRNNGEKVNDILCYSVSGDTIKLSELLKKQELVILYGGSNYCNSCIDYHIQTINKLKQSELTQINIVLMFKDINQRDLRIIKETNNLHFPLYSISSNLSLALEEEDEPVFLVIQPDLLVVNTFYPIKTKDKYNEIFYEMIYKKSLSYNK